MNEETYQNEEESLMEESTLDENDNYSEQDEIEGRESVTENETSSQSTMQYGNGTNLKDALPYSGKLIMPKDGKKEEIIMESAKRSSWMEPVQFLMALLIPLTILSVILYNGLFGAFIFCGPIIVTPFLSRIFRRMFSYQLISFLDFTTREMVIEWGIPGKDNNTQQRVAIDAIQYISLAKTVGRKLVIYLQAVGGKTFLIGYPTTINEGRNIMSSLKQYLNCSFHDRSSEILIVRPSSKVDKDFIGKCWITSIIMLVLGIFYLIATAN